MSTTQEHGNIPGTAVEFAPGLWRTSLQRYDLSVPGREMIQSRLDIEPARPRSGTPIRVRRSSTSWQARWSTRSTASPPRCTTPARP